MTANPSDIARLTNDGILLTSSDPAVKTSNPNATDEGSSERSYYFDDPAHGQIVLDELFRFVGMPNRVHEAIETDERLSLGQDVPIVPFAPVVVVRDDTRSLLALTAIRAYSFDMMNDRFGIELVGIPLPGANRPKVKMDSTRVTVDTTQHTMDER